MTDLSFILFGGFPFVFGCHTRLLLVLAPHQPPTYHQVSTPAVSSRRNVLSYPRDFGSTVISQENLSWLSREGPNTPIETRPSASQNYPGILTFIVYMEYNYNLVCLFPSS